MSKFLIGLITGIGVAVAVNETLKTEKAKDVIEEARSKIYDAIGELVDRIDPGATQ